MKNLYVLLVSISQIVISLEANSQTSIPISGDLGYPPGKTFFFYDSLDNLIQQSLYAIVGNYENTKKIGDEIVLRNVNEKNTAILLFPANIDGTETYAIWIKSNNERIKIPNDLPKEDQITYYLDEGQLYKGGIIRNLKENKFTEYGRLSFHGNNETQEYRPISILLWVMQNSIKNGKEYNIDDYSQSFIASITPRTEFSSLNYQDRILFLNGKKSEESTDVNISIQYFDGLGRPNQTVQRGITPSKTDLVSIQEYDSFGRESNLWSPAILSNDGGFVDFEEVKAGSRSMNNDLNPYSKPVYEDSPLNRIVKQYSPGEDWHTKSKSDKTTYLCNVSGNDSLSCITYSVLGMTHTPSLSQCGNYPTGALYATRTEDENGNISYEFKDKLDQVVLTRQINGGVNHDTYYVYNDFGNLCFVLPPRIQEEGISQDTLDKLAYQYRYDYRNRCIAKKLPACDWIYYAYDKADQLIFTQDGEQRGKGEWLFSIPDAFGRIALTGICSDTIPISDKVIKAEYPSDGLGIYQGYQIKADNESITFSPYKKLLTANYYDNYNFLAKNGFPNQAYDNAKESAGFGKRYDEGKGYEAKGQLTGAITALFGNTAIGDSLVYSTMYYDNRARLIQTHSSNHLGGKETEYVAYNFTGQPVKKLHVHSNGNMNSKQELYTYTYDHAGRLMETTHQLDNASPIVLAKNEYDELGRLKNVKWADNENLQTDYTYNIRSWTKSISSPLFTQNLYYNEEREGNTPSYNGNISRIEWMNAGSSNKAYNFGYDALSQLKTADYSGEGKYGANYSYDKHGNMLTLERMGRTNADYGSVDQLEMAYNGNQLVNVKDDGANVTLSQSADFKDHSNGYGLYEYNRNGAMTKDTHKGISNIEYNSLNLPMRMDINAPAAEARNSYLYSAGGVKLQVKQEWSKSRASNPLEGAEAFAVIGEDIDETALDSVKVTDYVGNKIYENGELIKILVDGGYYDTKKEKYYFYIQDHLGNNRVVADAEGNVVQRSDYYPFGMEFADNTDQDEQPYKYNGKELDKLHGLNMYDYSARYMEPAIGRFTSVDPLAEKYYSISPYVYVGNNPLKYTDPTGMEKLNGLWGNSKDGRTVEARRSVDNNMIHIYGHGSPNGFTYTAQNGSITQITSTSDLIKFLKEKSTTWNRRKKGEYITIVLHACDTGGEQTFSDGSYTFAFTDLISVDLPDYVTIGAPTGKLEVTIYGETIRKEDNSTGTWDFYRRGRKVLSMNGDMNGNPDMIKSKKQESNNEESNQKEQKSTWSEVIEFIKKAIMAGAKYSGI